MSARVLVGLLAVVLPLTVAAAQSADALCATPTQKDALAKGWASKAPRLGAVAREAGVSEAAALSALPGERAVSVRGSAFAEIWRSLQAWPDSLTVIEKSGQVFEVHGRIPSGEPSKVSRAFNLDPKAHGLTGHLRPDEYSTIYAASLPGRERVEHGILFINSAGQVIFGVYVPNEHAAAVGGDLAGGPYEPVRSY
jgi:heme iron utilization protein